MASKPSVPRGAGAGTGIQAGLRKTGFRASSSALALFALVALPFLPGATFARAGAGAPAGTEGNPAALAFPHVPLPGLRHNEVRLAGLEPGKGTLANAVALFGPNYRPLFPDSPDFIAWVDRENKRVVRMDVNRDGVIETITVSSIDSLLEQNRALAPAVLPAKKLVTGRGLGLGDSIRRVLELYGPPNSRGPSARGSRALEFLFYAFDWAGADVPQVMEIYCDAQSGRVLEITLAAPTL